MGFCVWPPLAQAFPDDDLTWASQSLEFSAARIREHIRLKGSEEVANLDKKVSFVLSDSFIPQAFAAILPNGARTISISNSLYLVVDYITEVDMIVVEQPSLYDCSLGYWNYLTKTLRNNLAKFDSGEPLESVAAPEAYAISAGPVCNTMLDYYPFAEEQKPARALAVEETLGFIYLHELGHHALDHIKPVPGELAAELAAFRQGKEPSAEVLKHLERSRQEEINADVWAVDRALDVNAGQIAFRVELWQYAVFAGGFDTFYEGFATHPVGVRRQIAVYNRAKENVERGGGNLPPEWVSLNEELNGFLLKIQHEFESGRKE